jgi:ABC-type glycerol-3-phosphate transport system substrate-binding protein
MESISGIGNVKKNAKFAWDLAPLPVEASMTAPQNSIIGGASLWVMKGHPKKEYKGVAAFMNFLAQNDMQELWHMETGYFPITITAYEDLKKKGYFNENPYQEVGIKQMTRRKPTKNSRGSGWAILSRSATSSTRKWSCSGTAPRPRSRPWTPPCPGATRSCASSRRPISKCF